VPGLSENTRPVPGLLGGLLSRCRSAVKSYGYGTDNISYSTCGARLRQDNLTDRLCPDCGAYTRREQVGPVWPNVETLAWYNRSSDKRAADRAKINRARTSRRRHLANVPLHIFEAALADYTAELAEDGPIKKVPR